MADQSDFDAAVARVQSAPSDESAWDEVENLAGALDLPDDVVALYREVLDGDVDSDLVLTLGERAATFVEEWYGDDAGSVEPILVRVLDIAPDTEWAFQRLTVVLTVTEKWDRLLSLYDRALDDARDEARRIKLLDEAAQVAKDVANLPDKAISYLQQLVPLRPDDTQLSQALERLLERHERWADLIALWESKLDGQSRAERERSRARIAETYFESLGDPAHALDVVRPLLAEAEDDKVACELLERIATADMSPTKVREGALDLLRAHYEATERPREIIRVLEATIDVAGPQLGPELREEAGARLAELDDDDAAIEHYAALLSLNPDSAVTQEKLRQIAQRASAWEKYAAGCAAAAEQSDNVARKVALLAEAGRTRLDLMEDETGAIELYQRALSQDGIGEREERTVARRLSELLVRADRPAERLDVLDRLARVESSAQSRRAVLGETARLAESLGETDRALDAWQARIDADPDDRMAIDAMIELLEATERWNRLIATLELRIGRPASPAQKRADLVRAATIYRDNLEDAGKAIDAWQRVRTEAGDDARTVNALADLLAAENRWAELAELLESVSDRETNRVTARLVRLAEAQGEHLGEPEKALRHYRNALAVDPSHDGARAGLTHLLDLDACRGDAADALADAYRETGDWEPFLELLEPRLAAAADRPDVRLGILREAAEVQERELGDKPGALRSLCAAWPLAPKDRVLENAVVRLAGETDAWSAAADAYDATAEVVSASDPHETARLRFEQATIYERQLDDAARACARYVDVVSLDPGSLPATSGVVRLGTRLGSWDDVAAALLAYTGARERIEPALLAEIEEVAADNDAFGDLVQALTPALNAASGLPPKISFELYRKVAEWHADRRGDPEAAEGTLQKALLFDQSRVDGLRDLAALQKEHPGRAYFDTLLRIADTDPKDFDVVVEAAGVAVEHLDDPEVQKTILTTLLGRATAAWRGTSQLRDDATSDPQECARWAVERLVELHTAAGNPSAAVDLLLDAARMPYDAPTVRAMRHRAAEIATNDIGDNSIAIELYRGVLAAAPDDTEAMDKLAAIYQAEERIPELLSLRKHQLSRGLEPERTLELRLEIARLVGEVEARGGRLEVLRANLEDQPGHEASVDALCEILDAKAQHEELAAMLEDQALKLQELDEGEKAALLWARVAEVSEAHLDQIERAIAAHRRVVALAPTNDALRALARLNVEREQPALAVPWFENLLGAAPDEEREGIVLQLARAHLGAGQRDRAVACIESYLTDEVPALELRTLLADLYRETDAWEPLARLLTRTLPHLEGERGVAAAREAAALYAERLEEPDKAIPALERALEMSPNDRSLRIQLAVGKRVAGRTDEAREMLTAIIKDFGRRRSAERAAVHVELARVARAEGEHAEALAQMQQASKMDSGNARIQKGLAEHARQAGDVDKAERTYRALLLVVRRKPPGDDVTAVGVSEVLYELHTLAAERGEEDQAKELLESALETAVQSDAEVHRLRRSLVAHDQPETLLRALEMRLDASEDPKSQGQLHADIADVLDAHLDRTSDALDAQLAAIKAVPDRLDLHPRARDLARRADAVAKYVDAVEEVVDRLRRKEDPPLVATLLMEAGAALEEDAGDLAGARALYERVKETGERSAEAFYAIARVADAMGDTGAQAEALDAMLSLAADDDSDGAEPNPAQIDALYRLAEIFVATENRREQGIELIEKAFDAEPRYKQAGHIMRLAAEAEPSERVMALYERVARNANDWEMLLDFLERRAALPDATATQTREAVELAVEKGQDERAEALLTRAVDAARDTVEGVGGAIWAVVALAERRVEAGDFTTARDLVYEIGGFADPQTVNPLALAVAQRAGEREETGDLAADLYEWLRDREPQNREIWEPLVDLYIAMNDGDRLQAAIANTLPNLTDPEERNALRMRQARYFIDELGRVLDAREILRDILLDDPDHLEAAGLLEHVLREHAEPDELADFLWSRFEDAKGRGNPETIADVALRLGQLLDSMGSADAIDVYRQALDVAPESRMLLRQVLGHLGEDADPREGAQLMERLLAVEEEERAPALTVELTSIYEALEDHAGIQRALELGHRAAPGHDGIHQRLETWYQERGQWQPLAEMRIVDAEHHEDPAAAVASLRDAAAIYRDYLQMPTDAAAVLRRARAVAPADDAIVAELAACLCAGGDVARAAEEVGAALAASPDTGEDAEASGDGDEVETLAVELPSGAPLIDGQPRVNLLMLRSDLLTQLGREDEAIADLDEAFGIDRQRVAPQLLDALARRRATAEERNENEAERAVTLRLAELLIESGETEQANHLLGSWVMREPRDRDALLMLRDMNLAAEHWEGVIAACSRLVLVEVGDEQIDAALRLADAAERAERPGDALGGLQMVHEAQPDNDPVRERLRRIYELAGAHRELSQILLSEATHSEDEVVKYEAYRKAAQLLLYSLGDAPSALEPARAARGLKNGDHDATILLVDALTAAGETGEAVEILEPAIAGHKRRSPQLASLQQRMARVAAMGGDVDNQMAWLKKAFDVDRKNGEIAAELAQLATERGDYDLALKPLRAITLMDDPGPVTRTMALLWEAKIEHARGNRAKAELWAKKALREDPSYAEAQQFLEQIQE